MRTVIGRTASIEKNATWEQVKTKGRMIFDEGGVLSVEDIGGGAWYCQVDSSVAGSNGKPYAPNELPTIGAVYDVIIAAGGWEGESGSPKNVGGWIRWCGCTCPWYVYRCEPDGRWHDRICSHIYAAVLAINKENRLPNGFQGDRGASMKHAGMKHIGRKVGVGTIKKMDPQEFAQRYCDWWRKIESAWIFGDEMPVDNYWEAESQGGDLLLKVDEKASDWAEDFYYFVKQYQGDDIISTFYRNETTCVAFYATAQEMAGKRASRTAYTNAWGTESISGHEIWEELIQNEQYEIVEVYEDTESLEQEKLDNDNWDKLDSEYYAYPYLTVHARATTNFDNECFVTADIKLTVEEGYPFLDEYILTTVDAGGNQQVQDIPMTNEHFREWVGDYGNLDFWKSTAWVRDAFDSIDDDPNSYDTVLSDIAEGFAQYYNYISIMSASKKAYLEPSEWEDIGDSFYCPSNLDYENELEFNVYEDGGRWYAEVWEMDGYSTGEGEWFDTEEEAKAWCEQFSEDVSEGRRENPRFASRRKMAQYGGASVRDWYLATFPADDMGENIDPSITFDDVIRFLEKEGGRGIDIYDFIGVGDSLVRERILGEISYETGIDYDYWYTLCLQADELRQALSNYTSDYDIKYALGNEWGSLWIRRNIKNASRKTIKNRSMAMARKNMTRRKKAQYSSPDAYILQWTLAPQAGYHEERFDFFDEMQDFIYENEDVLEAVEMGYAVILEERDGVLYNNGQRVAAKKRTRTATRNFTYAEQQSLQDESLGEMARNRHKLKNVDDDEADASAMFM